MLSFKEHFWLADLAEKVLGEKLSTKTSEIENIEYKKNPIKIQLRDGTKLFFTLDEFKNIKSKPEVGKKLTVVFLRKEKDKDDQPSQIMKCFVN